MLQTSAGEAGLYKLCKNRNIFVTDGGVYMSNSSVTDVTITIDTFRFQRLVKMSCMMGYKLVYGSIYKSVISTFSHLK